MRICVFKFGLNYSASNTWSFVQSLIILIFCIQPKGECIRNRRKCNQNRLKEISIAESLEKPVHRTPTHDSKCGGDKRPQIEGIRKRQGISEVEKVGVSLPIQLGITEAKQVNKHQGKMLRIIHANVNGSRRDSGMEYPYSKEDSNSSAFEFLWVLNPNQRSSWQRSR